MTTLISFLAPGGGAVFYIALVTSATSGTELVTNRSNGPLGGEVHLLFLHPFLKLPWASSGSSHSLLLFRALGEFLPRDSRQVKAHSCPHCPLVAIGQEASLLSLACLAYWPRVSCWCFSRPLPTHLFPCGSLVISIPSLYPIGDFTPPHPPLLKTLLLPSSQLHHRPVVSFCMDPYICISPPGEGLALIYNPYLGPRQQGEGEGEGGGELDISQLPRPLGSISLLLPSFRTIRAWLYQANVNRESPGLISGDQLLPAALAGA